MVTFVSRLAFAIFLTVSSHAVAGLSHAQPIVGAVDLITATNLGAGECDHCDGCSKPCVVPVVCNSPCSPMALPLTWTEEAASKTTSLKSTEGSRFRSAVIRAPTPPPRFFHFV